MRRTILTSARINDVRKFTHEGWILYQVYVNNSTDDDGVVLQMTKLQMDDFITKLAAELVPDKLRELLEMTEKAVHR